MKRAMFFLGLMLASPRPASADAAPPCEELAAVADLKDLPPDDRRVFCAFAKDLVVDGCCKSTLHACLQTKAAACPRAGMLAAVGRAAIGRGADAEGAMAAASAYQSSLDWAKRKPLSLTGVPCRGAAASPTTMTLTEFADFDCPHCAAVQATIDRLLDQNKDLRLCALAFPLHAHSILAAAAALFAQGQGKYWEMSAALFADQAAREELEEGPYVDALVETGKKLGLDPKKLRAALKAGPDLDRATAQLALAKQLELLGTPSFFLDGRPLDFDTPLMEPALADERAYRRDHPPPK